MGVLYIAGSRPGAGATATAMGIAGALRARGHRVVAIKPLSTRDGDADAALLAGAAAVTSLTVVAEGASRELLAAAETRVRAVAKDADVTVVEGLPLTVEGTAAFAERLQATVIGVVPYARALGQADASVWRAAFGTRLAGVVINRRTLYGQHDASERLASELTAAGVPALGIVPEDRLLLAPTVGQIASRIGAAYFTAPQESERLVEHFMIGGLFLEWGGNYFGRYPNQAVIVRGGRADLQMSALNFPLACLILTGVKQPPQYVSSRAEEQDVPLLVVGTPTLETAAVLQDLPRSATIHHPAKAERASLLFGQYGKWAGLTAAAWLR
ncbi:MAG: phosphotransacetylase family protein [SAR202 cluster bacterium]|nr:phosphotransacetylase family protein [SAR202 cluster bacterium]